MFHGSLKLRHLDVGSCNGCGGSFAVMGGVANVLPVDVRIPGCPPRPPDILEGLLAALGRASVREKVAR